MHSTPLPLRQAAAPLLFACAVLVNQALPAAWQGYLLYDRAELLNGEYWRLLTAGFIHTNFPHAGLNILGILALWLFSGEHYSFTRYSIALVASTLLCSLAMFLLMPDLTFYLGLSGALHGIFVWGVIKQFKDNRVTLGLLLTGLVAKLLLERYTGINQPTESLIGAAVITEAHLLGSISGLLIYAAEFFSEKALGNINSNRTD